MKKNIILTLLALTFANFAFTNTVQPTISMRFNDVLSDTNDIIDPVLALGFAMNIEEGVSAGFDSDGTDSRIFVSFDTHLSFPFVISFTNCSHTLLHCGMGVVRQNIVCKIWGYPRVPRKNSSVP